MRFTANVHGSQPIRPQTVEINYDTVYVRSNVRRETLDMGNGQMAEFWVYDENQFDRAEYDQILNLAYDIPDGEWNAGLQSAYREARYKRMDGAEQSARRKIELGIDVEQNRAKLDKILAYKQAVHDTMNQPGYPANTPTWPPEPML